MKPIRTHIMSRKVQWSVAQCFQCGRGQRACGLPCMVPCSRLPVLVKGRLYYRFLCQHCVASIWGTICPQSTLPSRLLEQQRAPVEREAVVSPVAHPFKRGQQMGNTLIEQGMIDVLDLTTTHQRAEEALRYAQYAYPLASGEDVRTVAAGILHQWAHHKQWR